MMVKSGALEEALQRRLRGESVRRLGDLVVLERATRTISNCQLKTKIINKMRSSLECGFVQRRGITYLNKKKHEHWSN